MQNDAGAAKWVEEVAGLALGSEIDENLGEFGREHAYSGVSSWSGLVATGVGGDVLRTDRETDETVGVDKFDLVGAEAEFVMVGGGGGEVGGLVGDDAGAVTLADELFFEFETLLLGSFGRGVAAIIRDADGKFAVGQGIEIVERRLVENASNLEGAAKFGDVGGLAGGKKSKIARDGADVFVPENRLEFGEGYFWLTS